MWKSGRVGLSKLFHLTLCVFGARWSSRLACLQLLVLCCWLCWYVFIWIRAVRHLTLIMEKCVLDCVTAHTLFGALTIAHACILLETLSHTRRKETPKLRRLCDHDTNSQHVGYVLAGVILPVVAMHASNTTSMLLSPPEGQLQVLWDSVPSAWGMQLKLISILHEVLTINVHVSAARRSLELLSRQPQVEVQHLLQLKRRYAELHLCFEQLNEKSGSSLLLLFIVFFMDFVFNAYWMMMNMLTSRDYKQHLWPHVGVLFNLGMLLTATCWHCQQSYNHSRHIGCLISKLVKPLGSKRYNDLVCEFLLQTLHQRFVVTAKDFFSLNLHLLSSMFAAVVTYLVILIQFMFAERGYKNRTNSTAAIRVELNKLS